MVTEIWERHHMEIFHKMIITTMMILMIHMLVVPMRNT